MDADDVLAHPRLLDEIFRDFKCRRSGLLKALTTEVDLFVRQCDPARENLCLYGYPDESWEVNLPVEEVPPELPEPVLGINFSRDGMDRKDWLSLVAVHSDSWLLAVAAFYAARFDKNERKKLFNQIIDLPTLYDVVIGRKSTKDKPNANNNGTKPKPLSGVKVQQKSGEKPSRAVPPPPEDEEGTVEEDEDDEHENTLCGKCGDKYAPHEFWIGCDICEQWYHGKCVKMTPAKAEHIKQYKCPSCTIKKPRL
eukprot:c8942_g1_i1 orf=55-813(+)